MNGFCFTRFFSCGLMGFVHDFVHEFWQDKLAKEVKEWSENTQWGTPFVNCPR
ncbi:Uncharacterized protein TCM_007747 [Theobroma cacao]|uniref:Uncharacterized protein n=1 Tax=Theobroma cacao TaxID=3641 RepID=A0A061E2J8_THECC|nr:Uncharacterized protein TCM_007747 [Theobroma cacao]